MLFSLLLRGETVTVGQHRRLELRLREYERWEPRTVESDSFCISAQVLHWHCTASKRVLILRTWGVPKMADGKKNGKF